MVLLVICRDLRMHKLVFEEDVLPDGIALSYFACGEVIYILINGIYIFSYLCLLFQLS